MPSSIERNTFQERELLRAFIRAEIRLRIAERDVFNTRLFRVFGTALDASRDLLQSAIDGEGDNELVRIIVPDNLQHLVVKAGDIVLDAAKMMGEKYGRVEEAKPMLKLGKEIAGAGAYVLQNRRCVVITILSDEED